MRQILSTALVALVVGAFAGASVGAIAQEPVEPAAAEPTVERSVEPAGLNADKVDGNHAVSFTNKRTLRKNKLVATNRRGELPSNIVRPRWNLIQQVPAGFKDGVDDEGITGLRVTLVSASATINANSSGSVWSPACPSGSVLVGGGHYADNVFVHNATSFPKTSTNQWGAGFKNNDPAYPGTITAYALCLSTEPGGSITRAGTTTGTKG